MLRYQTFPRKFSRPNFASLRPYWLSLWFYNQKGRKLYKYVNKRDIHLKIIATHEILADFKENYYFRKHLLENAVLWKRNYLLRFRFWLLKSYGSGSGSVSNFWKVVPVPVPIPIFEKVTVPVPVPIPASYLDHKKQIFFFFLLFT